MKRILLKLSFIVLPILVLAQYQRPTTNQDAKEIALPKVNAIKQTNNFSSEYKPFIKELNHSTKSGYRIEEHEIGETVYDLQSNACSPSNRFYLYPDGTMAGVWTRGMTLTNFPERGTGYNYYDGTTWGLFPSSRIENYRTGWPAYAPLGSNGEIVVAHHDILGLVVSKRDQKGTGEWQQTILPGPAGAADISWPKMVTSGEDRNTVHIIASTWSAYQGLDLALLYYRSVDGGNTWDMQHTILPGMSADEFTGVSGDIWSFAEPQGDKIAFLLADNDIDMFYMKSEDGGDTWTKNVVWENPYKGLPLTPMYYCPDGAHHIAFDADGKVHVVFGINASLTDETGTSWYPFIGGIGYWNEDMEPWINGDSAQLNPDVLYASGHLIGYEIDVNGNGEWFADLVCQEIACIGLYYVGVSSMPQLIIDDDNQMMMVYSSVTEGYDNGSQQYRKLWARSSPDGGHTWGDFLMLTEYNLLHLFDEEVYPSVAPYSDDAFHVLYQFDIEPGIAVRGDLDPYGDNYLNHISIGKDEILGLNRKSYNPRIMNVSQNYPNPAQGNTQFALDLMQNANVNISVFNSIGQNVISYNKGYLHAGRHIVQLDLSKLNQGFYTYSVKAGNDLITRKLIVY